MNIKKKQEKIERLKKSVELSLDILFTATRNHSEYEQVLDLAILKLSRLQESLLKTSLVIQAQLREEGDDGNAVFY